MKRTRRIGVSLLAVATGWIVWTAWPRPQLLLSNARPVANIAGWQIGYSTWFWLSDHEILHFQEGSNDGHLPYHLDTRTWRDEPLEPLHHKLDRVARASGTPVFRYYPSPDGRHILFTDFGHDGRTFYSVASVDGRWLRQWPRTVRDSRTMEDDPVWAADSRSWAVALTSDGGSGHIVSVMTYPLDDPPSAAVRVGANDLTSPIGFLPDGRLLAQRAGPSRRPAESSLVAYALGSAGNPPQDLVGFPRDTLILGCALSPGGRRLAWTTHCSPQWRRDPLGRIMAHLFGPQRSYDALWLSDPNGARLRELGRIVLAPQEAAQGWILSLPRWTPDRRRVSFTCRGSLYAVNVD